MGKKKKMSYKEKVNESQQPINAHSMDRERGEKREIIIGQVFTV